MNKIKKSTEYDYEISIDELLNKFGCPDSSEIIKAEIDGDNEKITIKVIESE